jgi:hypothetical protein
MTVEMTRAQIQDLLTKFAVEQPAYRAALERNPRDVIYRQFGIRVPASTKVAVLQEAADQFYVVLPYAVEAGAELCDADLEAVAGGNEVIKEASCSGGTFNTVKAMEVSIG